MSNKCEFIEACPFFHDKLGSKPEAVEELKQKYSLNNNLNCAHWMLVNSLGKEHMLPALYPHEKTRVYEAIAASTKTGG